MGRTILPFTLAALTSLAFVPACASHAPSPVPEPAVEATVAELEELDRHRLLVTVRAGLDQSVDQVFELAFHAKDKGPDARDTFFDHLGELMTQRETVVSELERVEALPGESWRDQRDELIDAYDTLRERVETARDAVDSAG